MSVLGSAAILDSSGFSLTFLEQSVYARLFIPPAGNAVTPWLPDFRRVALDFLLLNLLGDVFS